MVRKFMLFGCGALVLATGACSPGPQQTAAGGSLTAADPVSSCVEGVAMPITMNEMMVALVDFSADGVWRPAASEQPLTDYDWLLAEQDAMNLVAGTVLMSVPGTGAGDAAWVADDDWRRWTEQMQGTALQALAAVRDKDQPRLKAVGDALVIQCQTCHQKFKPGMASTENRFPYYPKRCNPDVPSTMLGQQ